MRYTRFFLYAISFLPPAGLIAQPQQKLKIEEAVVFLSGAELTSSAKISLEKGENEILFTNVAGDVNNQSISVTASGGVVTEAVTFQNNFLAADVLTPRAKEIKDSIEELNEAKKLMNDKLTVVTEQIAVLFTNKKVNGDNTGLSVTELTRLLDLYSSRYEGLLNQKGKQEQMIKKTNERINRLSRQLGEEQKKGVQPGGQLLVKLYAKEATTAAIVIDYIVPHAGWAPTYDVTADAINAPVKLSYKANIYQSSGVNWNNVKLSLSTGNPNEGVNAPSLPPWYLAYVAPMATMAAYNKKMVYNSAAPGVYQSGKASYLRAAHAENDSAGYMVDGIQVNSNTSMNNYVTVDNGGVNTTFDIDLPYSIPSDGKEHLVAVKKYELPATYRYYAVPKLDNDAFLQAQVTNWEELNLLPGTTNIFYEGTYVGQGTIDVRNVKDTFTISLGRDKKVIVKRERDTKFRSVHTIGANVRETFGYSITVRNTRKENISLTIQDQMPVSNDKDIVLEDLDYGGATAEENTGLMNWNLQIAPNETRKLGFGFTVKYLKGKTIGNLR